MKFLQNLNECHEYVNVRYYANYPVLKKIKKNKKGNLIRFDRALVLKVRVFGTRKWPIIYK